MICSVFSGSPRHCFKIHQQEGIGIKKSEPNDIQTVYMNLEDSMVKLVRMVRWRREN